MGTDCTLHAIDGAQISAWLEAAAQPSGVGVVIVQEIFGVSAHIRAVAADYAARGFDAIAPRFFDRIAPGTELNCDEAGTQRGRELVTAIGLDAALRDVHAAALLLRQRGARKVAVIGYCWGGTVAYLSATRLGLPAISYYGRLVPDHLHERPQAPLLFHFGDHDDLIPPAAIERIAQTLPDTPLHRYPTGHAFNRLGDPHGHPQSAALALQRSLDFLERL